MFEGKEEGGPKLDKKETPPKSLCKTLVGQGQKGRKGEVLRTYPEKLRTLRKESGQVINSLGSLPKELGTFIRQGGGSGNYPKRE